MIVLCRRMVSIRGRFISVSPALSKTRLLCATQLKKLPIGVFFTPNCRVRFKIAVLESILVDRLHYAAGGSCSCFLAPVEIIRVCARKMDPAYGLDNARPDFHQFAR